MMSGGSLFVRPCYETLYKHALEEAKENGVLLLGNPGIGKSAWLNYVLIRVIKEKRFKTIVLERRSTSCQTRSLLIVRKGLVRKLVTGDFDSELTKWLSQKATLYMYDPPEFDLEPVFDAGVAAKVIVAASPNDKHYKGFFKNGARPGPGSASVYYCPLWTLEEVTSFYRGQVPEPVARKFFYFGGVPRRLFKPDEITKEQALSDLEGSLSSVRLTTVTSFLNAERGYHIPSSYQTAVPHTLFAFNPLPDFRYVRLGFVSDFVTTAYTEHQVRNNRQRFLAQYDHARRDRWQSAFAGHLFEAWSHFSLPGRTVTLERVRQKAQHNRRIAIPEGTDGFLALAHCLNPENPRYFRPDSAVYPVIDSACLSQGHLYVFQMTLAAHHRPRTEDTFAQFIRTFEPYAKKNKNSKAVINFVWVIDKSVRDFGGEALETLLPSTPSSVRLVQWKLQPPLEGHDWEALLDPTPSE